MHDSSARRGGKLDKRKRVCRGHAWDALIVALDVLAVNVACFLSFLIRLVSTSSFG